MKYSELAELIVFAGAYKADAITVDKLALSDEFRRICESNSCGKYGRCYMCPPDIGDIEAMMTKVRSFPGGILYQSVHELEDSFDFEGMMDAAAEHSRLSQRIRSLLETGHTGRVLHLTSGGCGLCPSCAKTEGLPCRFPDRALPSMEGYGIDVYNSSRATSLKYINGQNTVTYFGIVML